jgi:hypothetical protein
MSDPDTLAKRCADALWSEAAASRRPGMTLHRRRPVAVGSIGIDDVRVTGSSDGAVVAKFRGHSRLSGGRFFSDDA